MQFSVGVEYALHCLLYMVDIPQGKTVGIKDLAKFQGISETYLSKVYTKLRKAGIVRSVPGVNGGYELSKNAYDISFFDVIEAIEGSSPLFQCAEIIRNDILQEREDIPKLESGCPCTIKVVMLEAEEKMRNHLRDKSLGWLRDTVHNKIPKEKSEAMISWFNDPSSR